jgi:hypothetical protein
VNCTEASIKQNWGLLIETGDVSFFLKLLQFSFLETLMFPAVAVCFYLENVIQKCKDPVKLNQSRFS